LFRRKTQRSAQRNIFVQFGPKPFRPAESGEKKFPDAGPVPADRAGGDGYL
jgi:hypothetical protein